MFSIVYDDKVKQLCTISVPQCVFKMVRSVALPTFRGHAIQTCKQPNPKLSENVPTYKLTYGIFLK